MLFRSAKRFAAANVDSGFVDAHAAHGGKMSASGIGGDPTAFVGAGTFVAMSAAGIAPVGGKKAGGIDMEESFGLAHGWLLYALSGRLASESGNRRAAV